MQRQAGAGPPRELARHDQRERRLGRVVEADPNAVKRHPRLQRIAGDRDRARGPVQDLERLVALDDPLQPGAMP